MCHLAPLHTVSVLDLPLGEAFKLGQFSVCDVNLDAVLALFMLVQRDMLVVLCRRGKRDVSATFNLPRAREWRLDVLGIAHFVSS